MVLQYHGITVPWYCIGSPDQKNPQPRPSKPKKTIYDQPPAARGSPPPMVWSPPGGGRGGPSPALPDDCASSGVFSASLRRISATLSPAGPPECAVNRRCPPRTGKTRALRAEHRRLLTSKRPHHYHRGGGGENFYHLLSFKNHDFSLYFQWFLKIACSSACIRRISATLSSAGPSESPASPPSLEKPGFSEPNIAVCSPPSDHTTTTGGAGGSATARTRGVGVRGGARRHPQPTTPLPQGGGARPWGGGVPSGG